ncbi:MAG: DUF6392 family protein [Pseudomonas sp.]|uniref:DUF6392 family protein n=1 Tax=Pseudomonas abieticivorans TaxID=2931382 RepID=UPI0020C113AC|nr:DUF6392 family protein [Pseudomonas sp. PIA16]MDE1169253.1 DUF6392 family protein [Pseudomonas sp.]
MKAEKLRTLVESLGLTYETITKNEIIATTPIQGIFPESEIDFLEAEPGLELNFNSETKQLKKIFVTIKSALPNDTPYTEELLPDLRALKDQEGTRRTLGEPLDQHGPEQLPEPVGKNGGWDSFTYQVTEARHVTLIVQYDAELQVETLVFKELPSI